jgi:hypothetical protein
VPRVRPGSPLVDPPPPLRLFVSEPRTHFVARAFPKSAIFRPSVSPAPVIWLAISLFVAAAVGFTVPAAVSRSTIVVTAIRLTIVAIRTASVRFVLLAAEEPALIRLVVITALAPVVWISLGTIVTPAITAAPILIIVIIVVVVCHLSSFK